MKFLRFNFCHPVKVHANFVNTNGRSGRSSLTVDSRENIVEIPVDKFNVGKWRVLLVWEHEGQTYSHQKDFEIKSRGSAVREL